MRDTPTNRDQIIDSRDIIERIDELESERADLQEAIDDAESDLADNPDDKSALQDARAEYEAWGTSDDAEELRTLQALAKEGEDYAADWQYGATLIREDYFPTYCRELVSDIGDMPSTIPDYIVIDWDATADNLRADYTEIDFDGETYLVS